jgi:hypothetical protein
MEPTLIRQLLEAAMKGIAQHGSSSIMKKLTQEKRCPPLSNSEFEAQLPTLLQRIGLRPPLFHRFQHKEEEIDSIWASSAWVREEEDLRYYLTFSNSSEGVELTVDARFGVARIANAGEVLAIIIEKNKGRREIEWLLYQHEDGSGTFGIRELIENGLFSVDYVCRRIAALAARLEFFEKDLRDKFSELYLKPQ